MSQASWRIWNKDDQVELRTYKRVTGELPEMESTKQLVELVGEVYKPEMKVLDVGCAAGHYFNGLKRIDPNIEYHGVDATEKYIEFAKEHFGSQPNANFSVGDIFALPDSLGLFDIVYCCNVLLHLPDFREPIRNLLKVAGKHCFIRTLIGDSTNLNRFLYTDEFDENNNPTNFVHQNTYTFDLLKKHINSIRPSTVELIEDQFDSGKINQEFKDFSEIQSATTRVADGKQIAGNVIFDWKWLKISPDDQKH